MFNSRRTRDIAENQGGNYFSLIVFCCPFLDIQRKSMTFSIDHDLYHASFIWGKNIAKQGENSRLKPVQKHKDKHYEQTACYE